ncbi:hypothetical protein CPC16_003502, partial [Podila verticillata]
MPALRLVTKMLIAAAVITLLSTFQFPTATIFGPIVSPHHPYIGQNGLATMHSDPASSDTTSFPGPGNATINSNRRAVKFACPILLRTSDGYVFRLYSTIFSRTPIIHLFDSQEVNLIAEFAIAKGNIPGGVYAYVDYPDKRILTDGNNQLLRIGKSSTNGKWALIITETLPLTLIPASDSMMGLVSDWQGYAQFATANDLAGYIGSVTKNDIVLSLKATGVLISTTFATYLLSRDDVPNTIKVLWRQAYDCGPARKPAQLSWGTGSTPTFFGFQSGHEYVTIVDNASPLVNLLVYRTKDGTQVYKVPIFDSNHSGSENLPLDPVAPFLSPAATVTRTRRSLPVSHLASRALLTLLEIRSSAIPKLSLADKKTYTLVRQTPLFPNSTSASILDNYYYTTIDSETGNIDSK